jgi:hypothetical protein
LEAGMTASIEVFDTETEVVNDSAKSELIKLAVPSDSGLYFPPQIKRETLYTNLLKMT